MAYCPQGLQSINTSCLSGGIEVLVNVCLGRKRLLGRGRGGEGSLLPSGNLKFGLMILHGGILTFRTVQATLWVVKNVEKHAVLKYQHVFSNTSLYQWPGVCDILLLFDPFLTHL